MPEKGEKPPPEGSLDPSDWASIRVLGHRMLDDMFNYLEHIRERPVWQPIPEDIRARFRENLPRMPEPLVDVYAEFSKSILPYTIGNAHPTFMGWVHGGGTPVGMLAEMLAAGLNANCGGRDHIPIEVEHQITLWMRELYDFPEGASGLFVTGSSMANLIAVLVARSTRLGAAARREGVTTNEGAQLRAYASVDGHSCIARAIDISGLGVVALRKIATDALGRMNTAVLREAIAADRAEGLRPFLVVGTAGTVDRGAVDDLRAIGAICRVEDLHFHVDGAFGALAAFAPSLRPLIAGIETADSIAFDFHKWGQVPYDAGFILVRDGERHRQTFAAPAAYLRRETRGMAAGSPWPCDYGPDLSRGFRALKTWFTLKTYGTDALGATIVQSCDLARYLARRIAVEPRLELLAPVVLNIVCFRYRAEDADRVNADIVADLHESGIAAPSSTTIEGQLAIRAAFVNHRTGAQDVDALVRAVLRFGERRAQGKDRDAVHQAEA